MRVRRASLVCAVVVAMTACAWARPPVPEYNSLPGAHAKIYLDFDGDFTPVWNNYQPGTTPPYSIDADTANFSAQELANIQQIWSRVAEKYSPFNINVTTVDPGNRNDLETTHVVIGGNGAWFGGTPGGVASTGSFYSPNFPNTAFVFPNNLLNGDPKRVGEASSHEAGHTFGLIHQSQYDAQGNLLNEYHPGNPQKAPTMGNSYSSVRGLWWRGPTFTVNSIQDDLAIISDTFLNGFGYRADDHGNSLATATPVAVNGNSISGGGIIGQTSDADWFSFQTLAGDVSFFLSVPSFGPTLDSTLSLFDAAGVLVAQSATLALSESIFRNVAAGDYFLAVTSAGNYGDIGTYTLSGTIVAVPEPGVLSIASIVGVLLRRRAYHSQCR